ncbi:RNA polymerase sigma factor [Chitinophaga qingshengii]|uniref:Sigma-70 family RNA polymerase sigma factor n=1 Tax=Chitinophaga qingshengii TaxID=1569794 RepID=A0ABR7TH55_9BACT|nr:sigma-70 family RNA polymerase sigma factor [Chitinophaga qingshengii]MBC9929836.1 sigma-70 family RNA polymerase sigma factor [Chitinophaga qingshengii]
MNTDVLKEQDYWTRFQNGDPVAYRHIYEKHWDKLFNYCYQVIPDADDCKDVMQDYFTQLWQHRAAFPVPDRTEAFLMTLLKYRVIDALRKKHIRHKHSLLFKALQDAEGTDAYAPVLFREELEKFHQYFSELPEKLRSVFRLHYIDALSVEEIATLSSKSSQTVRNQLNIASGRLRAQLKDSLTSLLL